MERKREGKSTLASVTLKQIYFDDGNDDDESCSNVQPESRMTKCVSLMELTRDGSRSSRRPCLDLLSLAKTLAT
jgi:hypothetical protein